MIYIFVVIGILLLSINLLILLMEKSIIELIKSGDKNMQKNMFIFFAVSFFWVVWGCFTPASYLHYMMLGIIAINVMLKGSGIKVNNRLENLLMNVLMLLSLYECCLYISL